MSHEHLSDEHLSAYLDGAAPDERSPAAIDAAASLSSCATCRQRLAALEAARALVRLPVTPVSSTARAEAVRAALSGAETAETAARGPTGTGNGDGNAMASLSSMASARRAGRQPRVPLTAAAAAVVVLALAAGIPIALSQHGSTAKSTAAHAAPRVPAPAPATTSAPTATGAPIVLDLGTVGSPTALRSQLTSILNERGADGGFSSGLSATTQQQSDSTAKTVGPAVPEAGIPAPFASCVATARQEAGSEHTLAVVATVTYHGTPALAVVVEVPAPTTEPSTTTRYLALVVARSDCRTLTRTTF